MRRRIRRFRRRYRLRTQRRYRKRVKTSSLVRHHRALSSTDNLTVYLTARVRLNLPEPNPSTPFGYSGKYDLSFFQNEAYTETNLPAVHRFFQYYRIHWIKEELKPAFNVIKNIDPYSYLNSQTEQLTTWRNRNMTSYVCAPWKRQNPPANELELSITKGAKKIRAHQECRRKFKPAVYTAQQSNTTQQYTFTDMKYSPKIASDANGVRVPHWCSYWFLPYFQITPTNPGTPETTDYPLFEMWATAKVTYYKFSQYNVN
ncbi:putative capsid protein [Cyclovirus CN9E]|nr:putative capsid protein [Cyclovirus CN9E]